MADDIKIGGSNDEKGYGGFSIRLILPDDIKFVSENQKIAPERTSTNAGPWMDITGTFKRGSDKKAGVAIFCNPKNPGYPEIWILREKGSMQNVVYPGRNQVTLPKDDELILEYRLMVHNGDTDNIDMDEIYQNYSF